MNVAGAVVRGVSTTYATMVGIVLASESVMIEPEALQVKISIWPGVSSTTWSIEFARRSTISSTWSNLVVNRLSAVRIPPFGPRLYWSITCE